MSALTHAEAKAVWELLADLVRPGPTTSVAVPDALHQRLARDAAAQTDYPPFDRALMDGYAVRAADFAGGRANLRLRGVERAGVSAGVEVSAGHCVQINTGAMIPAGADAVVPVENLVELAGDQVVLGDTVEPGQHIERRASHIKIGQAVLRAGSLITPGALASLIAACVERVQVYAAPRVALLCTGDELVDVSRQAGPGQIHDSNSYILREFSREAGGETIMLGRSPDEPAALRDELVRGLEADMLCVSGGMSKGTHDLVPRVLTELGVTWLVDSLNLKPGKPTRIGRGPRGQWVAGLPGNPVSCAVCFQLFCRPIIESLCGAPFRPPAMLRARLDSDMPPNGARPMFQPAEWYVAADGAAAATPLIWRGSGDPFGLASANALIHRPSRAAGVTRGESADIVALDRPR
ncbi:MAG: gephyrin-like molybdotransferase Glp [Phycisphaerae bacterium]